MARDFPFIGQLDQPIQIIRFDTQRNLTGEKETAQVVLCSPFAMVEDISGGEDVEGKVRYLVTKRYTIRYRSNVSSLNNKLAILHRGVLYDVVNVVSIGRRQYLQLIVKNYE